LGYEKEGDGLLFIDAKNPNREAIRVDIDTITTPFPWNKLRQRQG